MKLERFSLWKNFQAYQVKRLVAGHYFQVQMWKDAAALFERLSFYGITVLLNILKLVWNILQVWKKLHFLEFLLGLDWFDMDINIWLYKFLIIKCLVNSWNTIQFVSWELVFISLSWVKSCCRFHLFWFLFFQINIV